MIDGGKQQRQLLFKLFKEQGYNPLERPVENENESLLQRDEISKLLLIGIRSVIFSINNVSFPFKIMNPWGKLKLRVTLNASLELLPFAAAFCTEDNIDKLL